MIFFLSFCSSYDIFCHKAVAQEIETSNGQELSNSIVHWLFFVQDRDLVLYEVTYIMTAKRGTKAYR